MPLEGVEEGAASPAELLLGRLDVWEARVLGLRRVLAAAAVEDNKRQAAIAKLNASIKDKAEKGSKAAKMLQKEGQAQLFSTRGGGSMDGQPMRDDDGPPTETRAAGASSRSPTTPATAAATASSSIATHDTLHPDRAAPPAVVACADCLASAAASP